MYLKKNSFVFFTLNLLSFSHSQCDIAVPGVVAENYPLLFGSADYECELQQTLEDYDTMNLAVTGTCHNSQTGHLGYIGMINAGSAAIQIEYFIPGYSSLFCDIEGPVMPTFFCLALRAADNFYELWRSVSTSFEL